MNSADDAMTSPVGEKGAEIDMYTYGGAGATSVQALLMNLDTLRKYHIVFFPCSTEVDDSLLQNETVLKNLRQYVNEGGKIYVGRSEAETSHARLEVTAATLEALDELVLELQQIGAEPVEPRDAETQPVELCSSSTMRGSSMLCVCVGDGSWSTETSST